MIHLQIKNVLSVKPRIIALVIFLFFAFIWILFLTQGLPIGDFDDWDHILIAQDASWKKLGQNILLPWSPSNHWHGQVDRMNEMMNRRIFLTFMLKFVGLFAGTKNTFCHTFYNLSYSFMSIVWLRMQIGRRVSRLFESAKFIYQDALHQTRLKKDIGMFYTSTYIVDPQKPRINNFLYYADLEYDTWNKTKNISVETFRNYAQKGARYYVITPSSPTLKSPNIQLRKVITGKNLSSLFENIYYSIKQRGPEPLYIYQWIDFPKSPKISL